MDNNDVKITREYHESTKLTYINLRNKPPLYKSYPGLLEVPLPRDFAPPEMPTLQAVVGGAEASLDLPGLGGGLASAGRQTSLDLAAVARLLYFSAGLLHKRELPGAGEVHYRAAASAGALYPIEIYLVAGSVDDLEAGLYHFSPVRFALTQLRKGDHREELAAAAAGDEGVAFSPLTLVFASVFWRSAWKYRVRSYRYCLWDAGTMLANMLATAGSEGGMQARIVAGFVDHRVNSLLGLDPEREAGLCLAPIVTRSGAAAPAAPVTQASRTMERLPAQTADSVNDDPVDKERGDSARGDISYPEIILAHDASSLKNETEVLAWRETARPPTSTPAGAQPTTPAEAPVYLGDTESLGSGPLGATIMRRGSTRRFARETISSAQFEAILKSSTKQLPADFLTSETGSLLGVYIIANAVDGLPSGAYYFSPAREHLELLKEGSFREEAGHLCFEQALGADASVVMYYLADLDQILERYGNRGYRAAQLEAGVLVGNAYLCAHSLGLGATGMTFYDDSVSEFFSPHAQGKSVMFLVALGVTDATNRVRPFRSRVGVLLDSLARGASGGNPPGLE